MVIFFFLNFFFFKRGDTHSLKTALHMAVKEGSERIVTIMVEHGANVDLQDIVLIFF